MPLNLFIVLIIIFFFLRTKQTSKPRYFISRCNTGRLLLCGLLNSFPRLSQVCCYYVFYNRWHNSYYITTFCTVGVLYSAYCCTCICSLCWLCSLLCFQNPHNSQRSSWPLRRSSTEVPGWDAGTEPHTMPDLLCAALLFNWSGIGLLRCRKCGAEELPHKSVFRSASAELWTFLQSVLELPGSGEV